MNILSVLKCVINFRHLGISIKIFSCFNRNSNSYDFQLVRSYLRSNNIPSIEHQNFIKCFSFVNQFGRQMFTFNRHENYKVVVDIFAVAQETIAILLTFKCSTVENALHPRNWNSTDYRCDARWLGIIFYRVFPKFNYLSQQILEVFKRICLIWPI